LTSESYFPMLNMLDMKNAAHSPRAVHVEDPYSLRQRNEEVLVLRRAQFPLATCIRPANLSVRNAATGKTNLDS
jgi:hypothetical protein